MSGLSRLAVLLASAAILGGCATGADMIPVNARQPAGVAATRIEPRDLGLRGDVIALAFSGGGARAAATAHGVILGLRDKRRSDGERLIDQVAFVTAVSGGAVTAAWFGLHGPDGQDAFRAAYLDKDWRRHIHTSLIWPGNWVRLAAGGINGRDRIADWLDHEVYAGTSLAELSRTGPPVVLNGAELDTGTPFAFAAPWFQALCADLSSVRVADAVAGSMAYPLGVRPVVLGAFGQDCGQPLPVWVHEAARDRTAPVVLRETARAFEAFRDPDRVRNVHVVDGGLLDNFGLASLITLQTASGEPYGPLLSARDAVRITSLTVIVVNAERAGLRDWGKSAKGPTGRQVLDAALDHFIDGTKRNSLDAFAGHLARWERDTIDWRCALTKGQAKALGAPAGWKCADLHFRIDLVAFSDLPPDQAGPLSVIPTDVSLSAKNVDMAIAAGRAIVARDATIATIAP